MSPSPVSFGKPPRTLTEQVGLLVARGLQVSDPAAAERFLASTNYYRFVGYGLGFEEWGSNRERLDRFKPGTTFEQMVNLYRWDAQLRSLLSEALAIVEIHFRTALCYELVTATNDPFWHLNNANLQPGFDLAGLGRECEEAVQLSKEPFVQAYKAKYGSNRVPCWMAIELVSFNKWSKVYGKLKHRTLAKKVAGRMQAPPDDLASWMHSLVVLRNACAHHARLWDRTLSHRPSLTPRMKALAWPEDRLGVLIWIISDMLKHDSTLRTSFLDRLKDLLSRCPQPYESALGIRHATDVFR